MTPPEVHETDEHQIWTPQDDDFAAFRGITVGFCMGVAAWCVIGAMIWAAF